MRDSPEGFLRGAMFAILSIRQPVINVPAQLDALMHPTSSRESPLFGSKINAWAYLSEHKAELLRAILAAPDNATRMRGLTKVPGLGIVKAGFVLQLMGYDVACLDSRNATKTSKAFQKRIERYLGEVEGRAQEYWDAWCEDICAVYKRSAEQISELHLAIVPDDFMPGF